MTLLKLYEKQMYYLQRFYQAIINEKHFANYTTKKTFVGHIRYIIFRALNQLCAIHNVLTSCRVRINETVVAMHENHEYKQLGNNKYENSKELMKTLLSYRNSFLDFLNECIKRVEELRPEDSDNHCQQLQ